MKRNGGSALVEFAIILPFLLLVVIGMADLCMLLDDQLSLVHLGREAANILSRGADFQQTFQAITSADGELGLDGESGRVILTKIGLDKNGNPVITAQETIGGLNQHSVVGDYSPTSLAPATIPNGRTIPNNMSIVIVELFAQRPQFLAATKLAPGDGTIILSSLAAF